MIFYLKPPPCEIDLEKFRICSRTRMLHFLKFSSDNIRKSNVVSEMMIPNTMTDRTGHFVLKCFVVSCPSAKDFVLQKETDLFVHRLNYLTNSAVKKHAKLTIKQIETMIVECTTLSDYAIKVFNAIRAICSLLCDEDISTHFSQRCERSCSMYEIKVPFNMCLTLLRKREVAPKAGIISVSCGKWRTLLVDLFHYHYEAGCSLLKERELLAYLKGDVRWEEMFNVLQAMYQEGVKVCLSSGDGILDLEDIGGPLSCHSVNAEGAYFPPCMGNLLHSLREKHRLSHNSRYYFSLFLKDIGMPIEESVKFWQHEYSKQSSGCCSCVHSWQNQHKKYIYSIRHLYGLEGSRVNRSAKNCSKMQGLLLTVKEEYGCPFVHYSEDVLLASLSPHVVHNEEVKLKMLEFVRSNKPSEACMYYMSMLLLLRDHFPHFQGHDHNDDGTTVIKYSSPVECYLKLKVKMKRMGVGISS